ncbi:MAG TPA: hypothetical protein VEV40_05060 [Alloacidobacterium sp.]|nr:hypothetical protein [Alloacidobacterium sp.]
MEALEINGVSDTQVRFAKSRLSRGGLRCVKQSLSRKSRDLAQFSVFAHQFGHRLSPQSMVMSALISNCGCWFWFGVAAFIYFSLPFLIIEVFERRAGGDKPQDLHVALAAASRKGNEANLGLPALGDDHALAERSALHQLTHAPSRVRNTYAHREDLSPFVEMFILPLLTCLKSCAS